MHPRPAALLYLLLSSCLEASAPASQSPPLPTPSLLIRNVRVFDGERVVEHRSVLIVDGRIAQLGGPALDSKGAELIDGQGRTLLPGLIDAHVHLPDDVEEASRQALVLGVTTQLDMFSAGQRLANIKALEADDRPEFAAVRTAGSGATVPGGHPTQMGGPPFPTLTTPDQAQAFVDARIAEGSDYIKIIHDDGSTWTWTDERVPMLPNATMRALVLAAHERGKVAVVHALSEQQARDAIAAGADGLAHLFTGDRVGADFAALAVRHRVFVITTLSAAYLNCGKPEGPALLLDPKLAAYVDEPWQRTLGMPKTDPTKNHYCTAADEAIRQLARAHVPLLAGTDAPIPGATYGASIHSEMALLVRDGLEPVQALAAATSAPARAFHLDDRGFIRPGMRADLLLVDGNPTTDILATRNILAVWKRGVKVARQGSR